MNKPVRPERIRSAGGEAFVHPPPVEAGLHVTQREVRR